MASGDSIRGLKIVVISLGLVLAGGFVFVIGALAHQFRQSGIETKCEASAISLPEGYHIEQAAWRDGRLELILKDKGTLRALILDGCSGKMLSDLTLTPGR